MDGKKHGKHGDYQLAHLRVEICKTKEGLMTHHQPETKEDEEILSSWGSGGMAQVATALLNEGVKREIYLAIFSELSQGGNLSLENIENNVYDVVNGMVKQGIKNMTPLLVEAFSEEEIKK